MMILGDGTWKTFNKVNEIDKNWTFIRENASLPIESKTKSNWSIIVKVPQSKRYLKDMVRAQKTLKKEKKMEKNQNIFLHRKKV